ncbi:MAG: hypothetical protein Q8R55_04015 [Candidatus Taylorbacteria bacterium]|nr:hypothetical protein [Candidatus Taylorbacteria bacterium]
MSKKSNYLQKTLIAAAVVTFVFTIATVIYSLGFLSNNLLHALRSQTAGSGGLIEFDIKGFEALGL